MKTVIIGRRRGRPKYVPAQLHRGGLDPKRGRRDAASQPVSLPRVLPWDLNTTEPRTGSGPSHDRASALIEWHDLPDGVSITDTDRIFFSEGRLQGWWSVDGKPAEWTRGLQIPLTRGRTADARS